MSKTDRIYTFILLRYACLLPMLLCYCSVFAVKPYVMNIYREDYRADNKNWTVAQDEKGITYIANDMGLLEFDGVEWRLNKLPNNLVVRSVAVESHNTIYTGSYQEFGRWDRDYSGRLVYTSLSDKIDKSLFQNDDFWKIWIDKEQIYFQSFSSIFTYDYKTVGRIPSDHGFLFLSKVGDNYLVQQIVGPLYWFKGSALEKIDGSEIFWNTDVRVILPFGDDKYLIGTSTKGLYVFDGKTFAEWNPRLSALMNLKELNCGLLASDGKYYFGTILDGIYVTDPKGNVLEHIYTETGLQNNTILSVHEDRLGNIWTTLGRGIAYIQYLRNMDSYIDKLGKTGTVYDAALWNGQLFIGTNQGVFSILYDDLSKPDVFSAMKLIDGTQGQVWALKIIDGKLYCCHNKGLKQINKNLSVTDSYNIDIGVYNLSDLEIRGKNYLVLSTYYDLRMIDKQSGQVYLPGQLSEPVTNTLTDHLDNLWFEHANRGVYRARLDVNTGSFLDIAYYGGNSGDSLPYRLRIFRVGGKVALLGDDKFYVYNDIDNRIVPDEKLNLCFRDIKDIRRIIHIRDNLFWALTGSALYKFRYDGYEASVIESYGMGANLSLVNSYENVSILNDSLNLVCLDNGFLLYKSTNRGKEPPHTDLAPYIESVRAINAGNRNKTYPVGDGASVSYGNNTISLRFLSNETLARNLLFSYKLENVDPHWSEPRKTNTVTYERLPKGEYRFLVRTVDNLGNYSDAAGFTFTINPPWYQAWWAYLSYIILFILVLYTIWILILRRYRNLHLQKIRSRETKRLRALTGKLQKEINIKNAELVTQTTFIIQKNELIMKLRRAINNHHKENNRKASPLYQEIDTLLSNVDTEDDWRTFLIKFEQKHATFFKKLKEQCPQLTPNDLRLCACIKLNLDIKETASLMNLSVRAVENNRYRLRKKLNLKPSDNLYDFFILID